MAKGPVASKQMQRKTGIDPGGVLISHGCWCESDVLSAQEACNTGDPISYFLKTGENIAAICEDIISL